MSEMKADLLRQEVVRTITVQFEENSEEEKKLFNTLELNYHFIFQRASVPKFMMIVC